MRSSKPNRLPFNGEKKKPSSSSSALVVHNVVFCFVFCFVPAFFQTSATNTTRADVDST